MVITGSEDEEPTSPPDTTPHMLPSLQGRSRRSTLRILDAGERALREAGAQGFSMAAVAKLADLSVGGIYRRFASKEHLLRAIKDRAFSRGDEQFSLTMGAADVKSLEDVTAAVIRALVDFFLGEEALLRVLWMIGRHDPEMRARGRRSRDQALESFRSALAPHLTQHEPETTRIATVICWDIALATILDRLQNEQAPHDVPWPRFRSELHGALTAYLYALPPTNEH